MQSHGLPGYPDPDAHGVITITVSPSLDPASPLFQRAVAACRSLAPAATGPSAALAQRIRDGALAFAACMRAHGVPGFADPTFGAGGAVTQLSRGVRPGSGTDPDAPLFQAAQKTCQAARTRP
jgi:hypothetical protein